ncbi:MAG TPA: response regulator transcription factor [Anaerolineales bacterium]|nr:response regulator transcription factor [Anaerolineales bacterium]
MQETGSNRVPLAGADLDNKQRIDRPRVLIIDDDKDLVTLLKIILRGAGFDVASATDHSSALVQATEIRPHVILLDLMMPEVDGWATYQKLRTLTSAPVIVVTASANQDDAVRSLEMGAQDFITKPFYNPELVARIRKVLRQSKAGDLDPVLFFPGIDLKIDFESHEVSLRGRSIYLTPQEFSILKTLAENAPKSLSFAAICNSVWGEDDPRHRSQIKNIIFLLRRKLEDEPIAPKLIVNYRSLGYQLDTRSGGASRQIQSQ